METQKRVPQKNSIEVTTVRARRLEVLDAELKRLFPVARIALLYRSNWELLVAVILSAQCTDKKVNEVTARLFVKYPTLASYASADFDTFAEDIRQTGYYRAKARHILASARRITEVYGGEVPHTMGDIVTLPGVARKTANVVLGNAYGVVEGIAVDTHVRRFAIRFDLTDSRDPVHIERALMAMLPKSEWLTFTYRVIEYGRQIAPARKYDTSRDPLVALYPPAGTVFRV